MISNTDYSTDTSSDATDSRGTIYIEPTEIYITCDTDNYEDHHLFDIWDAEWAREKNEYLKGLGKTALKRKPINQPQRRPRPEINRRMMWCDRMD